MASVLLAGEFSSTDLYRKKKMPILAGHTGFASRGKKNGLFSRGRWRPRITDRGCFWPRADALVVSVPYAMLGSVGRPLMLVIALAVVFEVGTVRKVRPTGLSSTWQPGGGGREPVRSRVGALVYNVSAIHLSDQQRF